MDGKIIVLLLLVVTRLVCQTPRTIGRTSHELLSRYGFTILIGIGKHPPAPEFYLIRSHVKKNVYTLDQALYRSSIHSTR